MKIFRTYASRETEEFASELSRKLVDGGKKRKGALVIALTGDLGAGKTTFTQGFARGLGIKRRTTSPTFIIMRRLAISPRRAPGYKDLYHVDAYRIKGTDSLAAIGLEEVFADPKNIVIVEWPEKIKTVIPRAAVRLRFRHGKKENERVIS